MSQSLQRLLPRMAGMVALVAASGLAACGRNGPLEPPPSAQAAAPPQNKESGKPAAPAAQMAPQAVPVATPPSPAPKRHFFLDFLLN